MSEIGPITFRDHFASIFQSAVSEVGRRTTSSTTPRRRTRGAMLGTESSARAEEYEEVAATLMAERLAGPTHVRSIAPQKRTRELSLPSRTRVCAELALRYLEARLNGNGAEIEKIEGEFKAGVCDPEWASTIAEYLQYFGPGGTRKPVPYISPATAGEQVIEIQSGARIALVADWGTGARPALATMEGIKVKKPDAIIHLGDVYYSGTPREYRENFLRPIDSTFGGQRPLVYILAGNHDMYCGGIGYYAAIEQLNKPPHTQKASFFCLRTSDEAWQLLAMDTGLNDFNPLDVQNSITWICDEEFEWLLRRIDEFPGQTILLSHHPLFSAFSAIGKAAASPCNPHLLQFLSEANTKGQIAAWFWGHEHSLSIYKPYAGLKRGRCIGHGAVPVVSAENIYDVLPTLRRPPTIFEGTRLGLNDTVFAHGFAMITFGSGSSTHRQTTTAEYFQNLSQETRLLYSESI